VKVPGHVEEVLGAMRDLAKDQSRNGGA